MNILHNIDCCVVLCCVMLCFVLCCVALRYVMLLCYVMLRRVASRYVDSLRGNRGINQREKRAPVILHYSEEEDEKEKLKYKS